MEQERIEKNFEKLAKQLEGLSREIEKFVPYAIVKDTSAFGNSSHVVLSKNFLDKRVGVIILGDRGGGR
jgi:putative transposon-encoded protein